jgi:hydantoinase/carbamoylase family amidase
VADTETDDHAEGHVRCVTERCQEYLDTTSRALRQTRPSRSFVNRIPATASVLGFSCFSQKMAANGTNGVHVNGSRGKHDFSGFKVNQSRLMKNIHDGCEFGAAWRYGEDPTETGMARLSLNNADKQVRDWFQKTTKALGCKVTVDQMGNIFAIREGKNKTAPPIMMGSHLDTQPTGGRYDGILGVNAGLEVLRVIADLGYETEGNVGVINWTNEEGARFPMMAVSSGVWAEAVPLETAWTLAEVSAGEDGRKRTMKEELERIGYLGPTKATYRENPIAAHFEVHIEQGPILENEKRRVGVVKGVQAFKWFEVTVKGRDTHAGTTPFNARKDSMLCAARLIVQSNKIAKKHGGLATTGILTQQPGSINTMAHTVTFTLDIRHVVDEKLGGIKQECHAEFDRIAKEECEKGCQVEWKELVNSPAVNFHQDCIAAVEASAKEVCKGLPMTAEEGELWKYMISGAGHDSCYTNRRCPTSMIFTVTKDGVSHNPQEYCSPEDW